MRKKSSEKHERDEHGTERLEEAGLIGRRRHLATDVIQ